MLTLRILVNFPFIGVKRTYETDQEHTMFEFSVLDLTVQR
jgi:hypothetical protein